MKKGYRYKVQWLEDRAMPQGELYTPEKHDLYKERNFAECERQEALACLQRQRLANPIDAKGHVWLQEFTLQVAANGQVIGGWQTISCVSEI